MRRHPCLAAPILKETPTLDSHPQQTPPHSPPCPRPHTARPLPPAPAHTRPPLPGLRQGHQRLRVVTANGHAPLPSLLSSRNSWLLFPPLALCPAGATLTRPPSCLRWPLPPIPVFLCHSGVLCWALSSSSEELFDRLPAAKLCDQGQLINLSEVPCSHP